MASQLNYPLQGIREAGVVKLFGRVTLGTGGAIGTSKCKGFTVAKTAGKTGRYTVTLDQKYIELRGASVVIEGAAADTAYTTGKAVASVLRSVDPSGAGTLVIQFVGATNTDTELEDNAKFYVSLSLKNTGAW